MNIIGSIPTETDLPSLQSLPNRRILTQVGQQQLVFPSHWVAEIMLVERSQILSLPFYDPMLLGLVYYQGQIVPLISTHILLSEKLDQDARLRAIQETLTVIRLGQATDKLAGIGLVVERVINRPAVPLSSKQHVFQLSDLPGHIWQPH